VERVRGIGRENREAKRRRRCRRRRVKVLMRGS